MKKHFKLLVFLVATALMLSASVATAENEGQKSRPALGGVMNEDRKALLDKMKETRDEHRTEMEAERKTFVEKLKTEREAFKAEVEAKKEEFRLANQQKKSEWRGKVKEMLGQRFEIVVQNIEKIQTRVSGLIDKLNADGKDTTDAQNYLNLSKQKLEDAKVKITQIKDLLPTTDDKVTADVFEQIKLLARDAKDALKESRNDLIQAVRALKDLQMENSNNNEGGDNPSQ